MSSMRLLSVITGILLLTGCGAPGSELVLYDFETDNELNELHWHCRTLYSRSDQFVSHGVKALKLELYPSDYPGLDMKLKKHDWRIYKALRLEIYNPQPRSIQVKFRIDDKEDPDYADRYSRGFDLKPGMNYLYVPLNTLITTGTSRNLNLKEIHKFLIYIVNPERKVVLYIDHIRLVN